jgi:hypothetical protein
MRYLLFACDDYSEGGAEDIIARSNSVKTLLTKVRGVYDDIKYNDPDDDGEDELEPLYIKLKGSQKISKIFAEGNAHIYDTKTNKIVAQLSIEANDRGAGYQFKTTGRYKFSYNNIK